MAQKSDKQQSLYEFITSSNDAKLIKNQINTQWLEYDGFVFKFAWQSPCASRGISEEKSGWILYDITKETLETINKLKYAHVSNPY